MPNSLEKSPNSLEKSPNSLEKSFTSTGDKLFYHNEVLKQIQYHKKSKPIVTHIMPTSACNMSCSFCSIKDRKLDENLNLEQQIIPYIDELIKRDLKSVIISGGGEPTLYKDFKKLIEYIVDNNIEIGLITNGTTLDKYNSDLLEKFLWIRISINSLDYANQITIPTISEKTTLGLSYVFSSDPTIRSKILNTLNKIKDITEKYPIKYVRLIPDCATDLNNLINENKTISEIQKKLGEPFFHQNKIYKEQKKCYLGYVHPVLYCDGYVYPCDSIVLNDTKDQRFKESYRICRHDEVGKFFDSTIQSLISTTCQRCVFERQNEIIEKIMNREISISTIKSTDIEHKNFI